MKRSLPDRSVAQPAGKPYGEDFFAAGERMLLRAEQTSDPAVKKVLLKAAEQYYELGTENARVGISSRRALRDALVFVPVFVVVVAPATVIGIIVSPWWAVPAAVVSYGLACTVMGYILRATGGLSEAGFLKTAQVGQRAMTEALKNAVNNKRDSR